MGTKSAELTKYAANAMLATKISFINEMANIAELMGADIEDIRKGIGSDSRIGYQFIYPGCGYGGSCFPKDLKALIRSSEEVGIDCKILNSVEEVNLIQKNKLFTFINDFFKGDLSGKTFTIWGLSFKPNTDDMREASSKYLMESLWNAGANVNAYDPKANKECLRIYGNRNDLQLFDDKEDALKNANGLVICTEWKNFRVPDFKKIKDNLLSPVIFDGRNLFDPALMIEEGIDYFAFGRGLSVKN
jgi:UDPglucose 6-dehydrogenase